MNEADRKARAARLAQRNLDARRKHLADAKAAWHAFVAAVLAFVRTYTDPPRA